MRSLCLNHIEQQQTIRLRTINGLQRGRERRSNSEMYTQHNTSQTHTNKIYAEIFMENSKRVHSIFHSRSSLGLSPEVPASHHPSFIHSFQSVNGTTRSNYTLSFWTEFSKNRHFIFTRCVRVPSNGMKKRARANDGMGCIRTYALYHRIMCSFFLDFLLSSLLRLLSHVFISIWYTS